MTNDTREWNENYALENIENLQKSSFDRRRFSATNI